MNLKINTRTVLVLTGMLSNSVVKLRAWDQDLRFTEHISRKLQSAYISLKLIYQNRLSLPALLKSELCEALVLSQLNYCDSIYGPCLRKSDSDRLQRLQNSCLRLIFGIRKYDHISHCLGLNGWLCMSDRRILHMACFFHNILKNKIPDYLYRKISFRSDVHHVNIRSLYGKIQALFFIPNRVHFESFATQYTGD